ncbi:mCG141436, isoform CRA_b [Mus musculus]|nr:mCG141436, isoform CRA_b [Mus musculus]
MLGHHQQTKNYRKIHERFLIRTWTSQGQHHHWKPHSSMDGVICELSESTQEHRTLSCGPYCAEC